MLSLQAVSRLTCTMPSAASTCSYTLHFLVESQLNSHSPNGPKLSDEEVDEYAAGWSPTHRVGLPIDIARIVCFLASNDGGWINGKVLGCDGAACM